MGTRGLILSIKTNETSRQRQLSQSCAREEAGAVLGRYPLPRGRGSENLRARLGLPLHFRRRQLRLKVLDARGSHLRSLQINVFQLRHAFQVLETGIAHGSVGKVQSLELFQGRNKGQSRVGNLAFPKLQSLQSRQSAQMKEALVRDGDAAQIELAKMAEALQISQSFVRNRGRIKVDDFQSRESGQQRQTGVGQVAASEVHHHDCAVLDGDFAVQFFDGGEGEFLRVIQVDRQNRGLREHQSRKNKQQFHDLVHVCHIAQPLRTILSEVDCKNLSLFARTSVKLMG